MNLLLKKPVSWLPFVMSVAALILIIGYVALFGIKNSTGDEGTPARLFQLIMAAQAFIIAYFAYTEIPKQPKPASQILTLQIIIAAVPLITILLLEI